MKKSSFSKKLSLNKKTVANLNVEEMRNSRAGGDKTELGVSCDTGNTCCLTIPPRCNTYKKSPQTDRGNACYVSNAPFCQD